MRVVTPIVKPKSVSQQIKSQLTPVSTPGSDKKDSDTQKVPILSKSGSFASTVTSFKPPPTTQAGVGGGLARGGERRDLETVIGEKPDSSPLIPRKGRFDWDSQGEESPTSRRRADDVAPRPTAEQHHSQRGSPKPSSSISSSALPSASPGKGRGTPKSKSARDIREEAMSVEWSPGLTRARVGSAGSPSTTASTLRGKRYLPSRPSLQSLGSREGSHASKSKTLPTGLRHQAPKFSDLSESDLDDESDEEEDDTASSFTSALRQSREKIKKKSSANPPPSSFYSTQPRGRANTGPSSSPTPPLRSSPLLVKRAAPTTATTMSPEDKMSPLQLEILKASQERSNRLSKQQTKLTELQKKEPKEPERNSLAEALSKRLDSMQTRAKSPPDQSEDSFDDSPCLPVRGRARSGGADVREKHKLEGSPSFPLSRGRQGKEAKSEEGAGSRENIVKPSSKAPPPTVKPKPGKKEKEKGSESPVSSRPGKEEDKEEEEEWEARGRAPSLPWGEVKLRPRREAEQSKAKGSSGGGSGANEGMVNWKSALKTAGTRSSPLVTDRRREGEGGDVLSESGLTLPPPTQPKGAGKDEDTPTFLLPPPLPDSASNRFSFTPVEPPRAFMIEMEETSADVSPPPPPLSTSLKARGRGTPSAEDHVSPPSPTVLPPPLPESSPPPKLPSGAQVFLFPEGSPEESIRSPDSLPLSMPEPSLMQDILPSPIPSPIPSPVRERTLLFPSGSPLPPPSFGELPSPVGGGAWDDDSRTPSTVTTSSHDLPPPLPSESPSFSPQAPPPLLNEPPSPPSKSPPPLPSEPPPLLDSDTSYEQSTDLFNKRDNELPRPPSVTSSSSPGDSTPRTYEVTRDESPPPPMVVPSLETARREVGGRGLPKVAPVVAKKPRRGFSGQPQQERREETMVSEFKI